MPKHDFDTLDGMTKVVQQMVGQMAELTFTSPEDDWISTMFIYSPKGIQVMALPGEMFETQTTKDLLAELLKQFVASQGAYRYALLLNAHMAPMPKDEFEDWQQTEERVSERPNAVEVLVLISGDAEQEQLTHSVIEFTADGIRRAGPWEVWPTDDGGRFSQLNAYLRDVLKEDA